MRQTGTVKEKRDKTALVEIMRSSSCGENCSSCGLCPGQKTVVEAENDVGAEVGDSVVIDMADKKVLGAAFMVYIVPLAVLVFGYVLGAAVFKNEIAAIVTGFLLMILTFLGLIITDKRVKNRYTPKIVRVI